MPNRTNRRLHRWPTEEARAAAAERDIRRRAARNITGGPDPPTQQPVNVPVTMDDITPDIVTEDDINRFTAELEGQNARTRRDDFFTWTVDARSFSTGPTVTVSGNGGGMSSETIDEADPIPSLRSITEEAVQRDVENFRSSNRSALGIPSENNSMIRSRVEHPDLSSRMDWERRAMSYMRGHNMINIYEQSSNAERQDMLDTYGDPNLTSPPKDGKVILFDKSKKVDVSETVFIPFLGHVLKDDKRLYKDYLFPEEYVFYDEKGGNPSSSWLVYTDISIKGDELEITHNNQRTSLNYGGGRVKYLPEVIINGNSYYITKELMNSELFKKHFTELIREDAFIPTKEIKDSTMNTRYAKTLYNKRKCNTGAFLKSISGIPNTYLNTFGKKYQFGIEIETISGLVPRWLDDELFCSAVHDGSLRHEDGNVYGGEYVTDILQGDLGLRQLKKLCFELTKRCLVDKKCGVHVHLSGVTFTKENIVLMYYLYQKIQDEVYSMMPKSRRKNEYCRYLDPIDISMNAIKDDHKFFIDKYYNDIIGLLSMRDYNNKHINKKQDHPKGFKCGYDHKAGRYCWVNLIPAVFDTRKTSKRVDGKKGHFTDPVQTIEFRPMSASTSYIKIKNWLLICFALVDIIDNHKQEIYNNPYITLDNILEICYPKNNEAIRKYVADRKAKFSVSNLKVESDDYQDNEVDDDFKMKSL